MGARGARVLAAADTRSDGDLAVEAAGGSSAAFEALYRRHAETAWRVAYAVTGNPDDAADAVADAFTRVLQALPAGRLEDATLFRPYLLSATRNAAIDVSRRGGRVQQTDKLDQLDDRVRIATPGERLTDAEDVSLVARAFRSLPERWRSVLWLTEVEGIPPKDAAGLLGVTPNNAAQLAVRARAGLRERFVQAHLAAAGGVAAGCRFTVERLGAYVTGRLAPRDLAKVDQHLAACVPCRRRQEELEDVGRSLRRVALPLPLLLAPAALTQWQLAGAGSVAASAATSATAAASNGAAAKTVAAKATKATKAAKAAKAAKTATKPSPAPPAAASTQPAVVPPMPAAPAPVAAPAVPATPMAVKPRGTWKHDLLPKAQKPLLAASTGIFALGVISASVLGSPRSPGGGIAPEARAAIVQPVSTTPPVVTSLELASSRPAPAPDGIRFAQVSPDTTLPPTDGPAGAATPASSPSSGAGSSPQTSGPAPSNNGGSNSGGSGGSGGSGPGSSGSGGTAEVGVAVKLGPVEAGVVVGDACHGATVQGNTVGCAPPAPEAATAGVTVITDGSGPAAPLAGHHTTLGL